jgi:hypothetical protein
MFPHLPYTLDLVGKVTTPADHGKVMAPQAHDKALTNIASRQRRCLVALGKTIERR